MGILRTIKRNEFTEVSDSNRYGGGGGIYDGKLTRGVRDTRHRRRVWPVNV